MMSSKCLDCKHLIYVLLDGVYFLKCNKTEDSVIWHVYNKCEKEVIIDDVT